MSAFVTIFLIVATVFAFATIGYVIIDVILDRRKREEEEEVVEEVAPVVVPVPVVIPEPEPEPEPEPVVEVMPEIVEQIDAEEADEMISDELAMQEANIEYGAGHGKQGIVNIGLLDQKYEANEVITIASLKQKGLVPKNVGRVKILADGILSKPLTIKSESYSIQAIKMIELTGGTVIILKDKDKE